MNDIIKIDNALPDDLDISYKQNIFCRLMYLEPY